MIRNLKYQGLWCPVREPPAMCDHRMPGLWQVPMRRAIGVKHVLDFKDLVWKRQTKNPTKYLTNNFFRLFTCWNDNIWIYWLKSYQNGFTSFFLLFSKVAIRKYNVHCVAHLVFLRDTTELKHKRVYNIYLWATKSLPKAMKNVFK